MNKDGVKGENILLQVGETHSVFQFALHVYFVNHVKERTDESPNVLFSCLLIIVPPDPSSVREHPRRDSPFRKKGGFNFRWSFTGRSFLSLRITTYVNWGRSGLDRWGNDCVYYGLTSSGPPSRSPVRTWVVPSEVSTRSASLTVRRSDGLSLWLRLGGCTVGRTFYG